MSEESQDRPTGADPEAVKGVERSELALQRRIKQVELGGEAFLLAMVGAFFGYFFYESLGWRSGERFLPWFTLAFGTPFWVWRSVLVFRTFLGLTDSHKGFHDEETESGKILDMGFYIGTDTLGALRRFVIAIGSVGGFVFGVYMVGFHITVPAYIFLYLVTMGKVKPKWAAVSAAGMFGFMTTLFDFLLDSTWNNPVLFALFHRVTGL